MYFNTINDRYNQMTKIEYSNDDNATVSSVFVTDKEAIKVIKLLGLFKDVSIDTIESMLSSDAGRLARSVLINDCNSVPVRELVDELLYNWISEDTAKKFVTRQALLNELEDILKAKSITPYRRSRINKALKRACIKCHGGGKQPKVTRIDSGINSPVNPKRYRHEIDSRSPDCDHCKGTGINPKEVTVTIAGIEFTKAQLEEVEKLGENLAPNPWDMERNDGNGVG